MCILSLAPSLGARVQRKQTAALQQKRGTKPPRPAVHPPSPFGARPVWVAPPPPRARARTFRGTCGWLVLSVPSRLRTTFPSRGHHLSTAPVARSYCGGARVDGWVQGECLRGAPACETPSPRPSPRPSPSPTPTPSLSPKPQNPESRTRKPATKPPPQARPPACRPGAPPPRSCRPTPSPCRQTTGT